MFKKTAFIASVMSLWMAGSNIGQAFPEKAITIINPFSAGGPADLGARLFADEMSKVLQQPVLVESRPGGAGRIAAQAVLNAPADGYTLLIVNDGPNGTLQHLEDLPYDPVEDFQPISMMYDTPLLLTVPTSLGVSSLEELIALGKERNGGLTYGTFGAGSSGDVAGNMLKEATGLNMRPVPYGGGAPLLLDMIAGRVDVWFGTYSSMAAYVESGQLTHLATISPERASQFPDLPTTAELGYESVQIPPVWFGLAVLKDTPPEVVAKLSEAVLAAGGNAELLARFDSNKNLNLRVNVQSVEAFTDFMRKQSDNYRKILKGE